MWNYFLLLTYVQFPCSAPKLPVDVPSLTCVHDVDQHQVHHIIRMNGGYHCSLYFLDVTVLEAKINAIE